MDYSFFDLLRLIGSLGLFLYGMKIMSEGLQKFAGDSLRRILTAMTTNRVTGMLTGVLITALIQSSSATTVMVVSFVNAGLLTLSQSIGVIMGANIGTTVTAWIISALGFKIDIAAFALPLLAFAIPLFFSNKSSRKSMGEFVFGFAFLFMGLQNLKANAPDLGANPDMLAFVQKLYRHGLPLHHPVLVHWCDPDHDRAGLRGYDGDHLDHVCEWMDRLPFRCSVGIGREHRNDHHSQLGSLNW